MIILGALVASLLIVGTCTLGEIRDVLLGGDDDSIDTELILLVTSLLGDRARNMACIRCSNLAGLCHIDNLVGVVDRNVGLAPNLAYISKMVSFKRKYNNCNDEYNIRNACEQCVK